jgi:hypothetical protein
MDLTHFYESIKELSDFFGKNLTEKQAEFYFRELKYTSRELFKHAVLTIQKERKPTPANFPTISELQSMCPKDDNRPAYRHDETDEQYLRRITVSQLWEATRIYQRQGKDQAMEYMLRMKFSENDIEAVTHKATGNYPGNTPKIGKNFPKVDHVARVNELRKQAEQLTGEIPF